MLEIHHSGQEPSIFFFWFEKKKPKRISVHRWKSFNHAITIIIILGVQITSFSGAQGLTWHLLCPLDDELELHVAILHEFVNCQQASHWTCDQHTYSDMCMHACTHTHTGTNTHRHRHIHKRTHKRARTHTHTHTHTNAHTHTHTHICTHIHTHEHTHTRRHTHAHVHTHTHTHTCAHAHVRTHTHTHTQMHAVITCTCKLPWIIWFIPSNNTASVSLVCFQLHMYWARASAYRHTHNLSLCR